MPMADRQTAHGRGRELPWLVKRHRITTRQAMHDASAECATPLKVIALDPQAHPPDRLSARARSAMRTRPIGYADPPDGPTEVCYPIRRVRMGVRAHMHDRSRKVCSSPDGSLRSVHETAPDRSGARASCARRIPKTRACHSAIARHAPARAGASTTECVRATLRKVRRKVNGIALSACRPANLN